MGSPPQCMFGQVSTSARCVPDIDCVGAWSVCQHDCDDKVFNISVQQSGSGSHCESADGVTDICEQGDGECIGTCVNDCQCGWGFCTDIA
eukprot:SAG11_NODE_34817_length_270_cov_0.590643_1_plen_89_part_11